MSARDPKPLCERIGQKIRARREELNLSLDDLACNAEMSKTGLWEIETGRNEPRAGTLLRLCRCLRLSADVLLETGQCAHDELLEKLIEVLTDLLWDFPDLAQILSGEAAKKAATKLIRNARAVMATTPVK